MGRGSRCWTRYGSVGVWVVTGSRARRRRACSVFLFAASFATTGLKPCCCGVLEGGVRGLMKRTLSGMCQASGGGGGRWQQLACAVPFLTGATGSFFTAGTFIVASRTPFFTAGTFINASRTPCPCEERKRKGQGERALRYFNHTCSSLAARLLGRRCGARSGCGEYRRQ